MADNKCVVYVEPGKVSVETIDYPRLELPPGVPGRNRKCEHGVILRVVATNICGRCWSNPLLPAFDRSSRARCQSVRYVRTRALDRAACASYPRIFLRRSAPCKPGPDSVVTWQSSPKLQGFRGP